MQPENKKLLQRTKKSQHEKDSVGSIKELPSLNSEKLEENINNLRAMLGSLSVVESDTTNLPSETVDTGIEIEELTLGKLYEQSLLTRQETGGNSTALIKDIDAQDSYFKTIKKKAETIKDTPETIPYKYSENLNNSWEAGMKCLDLQNLKSHTMAYDSNTTLSGTPTEFKTWELADHEMQQVLIGSTMLMDDIYNYCDADELKEQSRYKSWSNKEIDKLASDARGKLYEVMAITYLRYQNYSSEAMDKAYIRSSHEHEDRSHYDSSQGNQGFDAVEFNTSGKTILYQFKNHKESKGYDSRIEKVSANSFEQYTKNIDKLMSAFKTVANNEAQVGS